MRVGGVVTRVPADDIEQAALACASDHTIGGAGINGFGKQAQDINAHRWPQLLLTRARAGTGRDRSRRSKCQKSASQSTRTVPAAKSTAKKSATVKKVAAAKAPAARKPAAAKKAAPKARAKPKPKTEDDAG